MGCRPLRILVADDNRDAADTAAILLRLSGYDVQTAYGGAEAIGLARAFDPDVAILDINMPSVDGYDVANALVGGSAALRGRVPGARIAADSLRAQYPHGTHVADEAR